MVVDPHELKELWLNRALDSARIDRRRWRPARGVAENRDVIEAVYEYYGRLFLGQPHLEWAGMASMVGPAFYAGFRDIGFVPDAVRRVVVGAFGRASRRLARSAAGDLGFHETTFLTMQKQIFEDQAPMHEAYLAEGIPEIERLFRARIIDAATLEAWREIDAGHRDGDVELIHRGNRTLLFREQHDIIDRFYIRMLRHRPEGPAFTYLLTLAGAPSIPGAHSYPDRYPLTLVAAGSRVAITMRTPLADGNIAVFANRWKLIDDDTLPDYLAYIQEHADEARALVRTPISERIVRYRLTARLGPLARAGLTHWDVDLGAVSRPSRAIAVQPTKPVLGAETGATVIDLTRPPTRASAGMVSGSDSRIWMNADHSPVELTVELPDGRSYQARAELAVMLSAARGEDPDRLAVRLPAANLDTTARLLAQYADEWGFPADAVADWRARAERRAASDRDYSTHVFRPDDVGFVRIEFQASDHVREGELVLSALFSWSPVSASPGS